MNTSMIKIERLTFSYGKKASVFFFFSRFLIGNGGWKGNWSFGKEWDRKSTLLYLMSGLLRPQNGSVWMKGMDVQKRLPVTLEDMYLVPEEFTLPNLSLQHFVKVNAPFHPRFSQELLRTCFGRFWFEWRYSFWRVVHGTEEKGLHMCVRAGSQYLLTSDGWTDNGLDILQKVNSGK